MALLGDLCTDTQLGNSMVCPKFKHPLFKSFTYLATCVSHAVYVIKIVHNDQGILDDKHNVASFMGGAEHRATIVESCFDHLLDMC